MGVEPLIALPPRVLIAGRLQCGAARAGVRRGHGECAELAHLARGSSSLFTARHAENGTFPREVGQNTILAPRGAAPRAQRKDEGGHRERAKRERRRKQSSSSDNNQHVYEEAQHDMRLLLERPRPQNISYRWRGVRR